MPTYLPICTLCENYTGTFRCRAFPSGIPLKYAQEFAASSHTAPAAAQVGGFVFRLKEERKGA